MKRALFVVILAVCSCGVCLAADKPQVKSESDKISYSLGYQIGGDFHRQGMRLDPKSVVQGIRDAQEGAKPRMTPQEMQKTLVDLKREFMASEQKRRKEMGEKNLAAGTAFLAANKKKEGVVTLPSGLQYKVLAEGKGKSPAATDNVTVNYRGTLIDGTEFDSSYKRGKPATFQVNRVIGGWTEALQKMKPGAKWQLFIPPSLAYGERGAGGVIGPNSTLLFDVELIKVN